jgi:hypothetical protein
MLLVEPRRFRLELLPPNSSAKQRNDLHVFFPSADYSSILETYFPRFIAAHFISIFRMPVSIPAFESEGRCGCPIDQPVHHRSMNDWDKNTLEKMAFKLCASWVVRLFWQYLTHLWVRLRRKKIDCHRSHPLNSCIFAEPSRDNVVTEPLVVVDCDGEPSIQRLAFRGRRVL